MNEAELKSSLLKEASQRLARRTGDQGAGTNDRATPLEALCHMGGGALGAWRRPERAGREIGCDPRHSGEREKIRTAR